jgi:hypothetical protein
MQAEWKMPDLLFLLLLIAQAPANEFSSPLEILQRYNIGETQLQSFVNGVELSSGESDLITKILYHFPKFGLENLHRWRQTGVSWHDVVTVPELHRGRIFPLLGRVKRVEKQSLTADEAERYEFKHCFKVTMLISDENQEAIITARRVPKAWPLDQELDEPADADGLFLKTGSASIDPPQLFFAAERLGWYPDRPHPDHRIGAPQLALGSLSMDVSLWDDVRETNGKGLTSADRECFYRLLDSVGFPAPTILSDASAPIDLVSLLEKPAAHFGDIVNVEGIARRVMKVAVSEPDIKNRFGIDHYYEIDLFLPLGEATLRLGSDPRTEKSPVYRDTFPATLIVRRLPPGLSEGENLHELIRAPAVFFKIWSYRSSYTNRFGQLQPAPLFIAAKPELVPLNNRFDWLTSGHVLGAFGLALFIAATLAWLYRSDRTARSRITPRQIDQRPDFSGLNR